LGGLLLSKSIYYVWKNLRQRCDNPNNPAYKNYGGRGITYDPRWKDFCAFKADMGECPEGLMLERIDNNKGYYKDNCKWANWEEQNFNKRISTNNQTGIKGVHYCVVQRKWVARGTTHAQRIQLYKGTDLFEACCARKRWERDRNAAQT